MSAQDIPQKLTCKRCGGPRVVTYAGKPTSGRVKLSMTCPSHRSEVVYRMPETVFPQVAGLVKDHMLLCRRCGQPTEVVGSRQSGRLTYLQILCPVHGSGERRVNTSLYDTMMGAPAPVPTVAPAPVATPTAAPAAVGTNYCPSCGTPVAGADAAFCHSCGASLE